MATLTDQTAHLYVFAPPRSRRYRVDGAWSLKARYSGMIELNVDPFAPWIEAARADALAFDVFPTAVDPPPWNEWSMDLIVRDPSLAIPFWSGPMMGCRIEVNAGVASALIRGEQFRHHFPANRRYLNVTNANGDIAPSPMRVENRILLILREALDFTSHAKPGDYGAASRNVVSSATAGWKVHVAGAHSPGTSTPIPFAIQDGKSVADVAWYLAGLHDQWISCRETPAAGEWTFNVTDGVELTDRSTGAGRVVLRPRDGSLRQASYDVDKFELGTQCLVRGAGSGATQARSWQGDATGLTNYGPIEFEERIAGQANVDTTTGAAKAAYHASPRVTLKIQAEEASGPEFGVDYHLRDRVAFAIPVRNPKTGDETVVTGDGVVVDAEIARDESGRWSVSPILGDYRVSMARRLASSSGFSGRGSFGAPWVNADG